MMEKTQILGTKSRDLLVAFAEPGPVSMQAYAGNDILIGSNFDDELYGSSGNDVLHGSGGDDLLNGGAGSDTLNGGEGSNILEGGDGNDELYAELGSTNILRGGDGDDLIRLSSPHALATQTEINGGEGFDTLRIDFDGLSVVYGEGTFASLISIEKLEFKGSGAHTLILGEALNPAFQNGLTIDMDRPDNSLTLDAHAVTFNLTVTASLQDDLLIGGSGADELIASHGNDTIQGGLGADIVKGGAGDDTLVYHSSAEFNEDSLVSGGAGFDTLYFGPDRPHENPFTGDVYIGIEDQTRLFSIEQLILDTQTQAVINLNGLSKEAFGNRLVIDASGASSLTLNAEEAVTALTVTVGSNTEANTLLGGTRNDTLTGGDGNDTLAGGAGSDVLTGGQGQDTFVWKASHLGTDIITDFQVDVDRLDFSDLFTQIPELHVGRGAYGIYLAVQRDSSVIRADLTGDGVADITVRFTSYLGDFDFLAGTGTDAPTGGNTPPQDLPPADNLLELIAQPEPTALV